MATLYSIDGTQREVTPANGTDFKLEELYALIDCTMIEVVDAGAYNADLRGKIFIIDEEGKLKDTMVINILPSRLFASPRHDVLVGNVLLCDSDEVR